MLRLWLLLVLAISTYSAPTDLLPAASYFVPSIPDVHQDPDRPLNIYAGHILADPKASQAKDSDEIPHLYFVMVKARRTADKERVMFWFNGGPGCSSFDGLMMEVGPWRMDGKGGFRVQDGGWEEYTTMVYVDQPAGTGFSFTSTNRFVHSLQEASEHLIVFLRNFYKIFPEYHRMDTYLGGESFAGQYIPYFADAILSSDLGVHLRGAAIGNGWIDARRQYPSYLDFAVKNNMLSENTPAWKAAKKKTDECNAEIAKTPSSPVEPVNINGGCAGILMEVISSRSKVVNGTEMCANIYDWRLDDTSPQCGLNWPPDIHVITKFLGRPEVVRALHASGHVQPWKECRSNVHAAINEHSSNSSITLIPKLLEKIPMLIFAGDQDIICNYIGIEAMINAMTWNGATGLGQSAKTEQWNFNNTAAGTWVQARNLTYVKIFNASHMAPFDTPHQTHDMILRFMGVNFTSIVDGSARIPSSVGKSVKAVYTPIASVLNATPVPQGKTPQQDKAMWEAYYNAGSAAIVLFVILAAVGGVVWCVIRRRKNPLSLPLRERGDAEESIPLNLHRDTSEREEGDVIRSRKGKERAVDPPGAAPIFDVGGSDDEDEERYKDAR